MDQFLMKMQCDRCGASLAGRPRIMSMFNMDCLCMDCKRNETGDPRYEEALEADRLAVRFGNYNYPGIGYNNTKKEN